MKRSLNCAVIALTLAAVAGTASAIVVGPEYPVIGGNGFSGVGNSGQGTGRTNSYTITTPGQYTQLYWGHWDSTPVVASMQNNLGDVMSLNLGQSNFAGGVAVWTGTSAVSSFSTSVPVNTRFTLTVLDPSSLPVPLQTGASIGFPGAGAVGNILGLSGFSANLLFEAQLPGGAWTPIRDLFNSLSGTLPGNQVQTSFSGGFYREIPTPGAAALLGLGGLVVARRRR